MNAAERYQIEYLGGDYAELARALGGHGERVSDPAEVIPALKRRWHKTPTACRR